MPVSFGKLPDQASLPVSFFLRRTTPSSPSTAITNNAVQRPIRLLSAVFAPGVFCGGTVPVGTGVTVLVGVGVTVGVGVGVTVGVGTGVSEFFHCATKTWSPFTVYLSPG